MTDKEIIMGNDEICQALGFESNRVYVYKVPNTFPFENERDTGWTELNTQAICFHSDWNMLVGAYNRIRTLVFNMTDTQKEILKDHKNFLTNFAVKNVFSISIDNQLRIERAWRMLTDFCKWYNGAKFVGVKSPPSSQI